MARRVAQLERHMRENKLRQYTSFVDRLGRTDDAGDEVRSAKEAKRLAFDIFWNARSDYSRLTSYFPGLCLISRDLPIACHRECSKPVIPIIVKIYL